MPTDRLTGTTWREFVHAFVPFALFLTVANLAAETRSNPTLAKAAYTIWSAFLLAVPALVLFALFDLRRAPRTVYSYWRLFWTFGYLAYLAHFYVSAGVFFGWDFHQIAQKQTWPVAAMNYFLTVLWGIEVLIALFAGQRVGAWFTAYQWLTQVLFVAMVYVSAIQFKSGVVEVIGWVVVVLFVGAVLTRLLLGNTSRWMSGVATREAVAR
ncbi:MAG TPA: hypothetical protein VKD90_03925 [Gemmataceae bacterium]|nr:hypothetical protein [Gemmataceae bacterium]